MIRFLAEQPNLDEFLMRIGSPGPLPADVMCSASGRSGPSKGECSRATKWQDEQSPRWRRCPYLAARGACRAGATRVRCEKGVLIGGWFRLRKRRGRWPRDWDFGRTPHPEAAGTKNSCLSRPSYLHAGSTLAGCTRDARPLKTPIAIPMFMRNRANRCCSDTLESACCVPNSRSFSIATTSGCSRR